MKLTTDIEERIDAIRDDIYERIKNLTPGEESAYFNAIADEARTKHNFHIVKSAVRDMERKVV